MATYVFSDTIKMGRSELSGAVSLADMADQMADESINGAHHFGSTFNHSVTGGSGYSFNVFKPIWSILQIPTVKKALIIFG